MTQKCLEVVDHRGKIELICTPVERHMHDSANPLRLHSRLHSSRAYEPQGNCGWPQHAALTSLDPAPLNATAHTQNCRSRVWEAVRPVKVTSRCPYTEGGSDSWLQVSEQASLPRRFSRSITAYNRVFSPCAQGYSLSVITLEVMCATKEGRT
jgi:hypothetical protein